MVMKRLICDSLVVAVHEDFPVLDLLASISMPRNGLTSPIVRRYKQVTQWPGGCVTSTA